MLLRLWLKGLFLRCFGRLLGAILGIALTVALLATIAVFTVSSAATMTTRAIAEVPVDWQIQLAPNTEPKTVIDALGQSYTALELVKYSDSPGFSANTHNTVQTTGTGKVLGITPQYRQKFPTQLRSLIGSLDGVLIAQQTAANLQVTVGDTVTVQREGLDPISVKIEGVVDLPNADSLFQSVGMPAGVAPQAPPDNILLLPLTQWQTFFTPQAIVRPDSIKTQLHVRLVHDLSNDPSTAYKNVEQLAKNLEARIAGNGIVGNNLAARLDGVRADSLYASILFLFLGLPGVILAILLTLAVAATGGDRRRSEQALLRTRGASIQQVLQLASLESFVSGIGGIILGIFLALIALKLMIPIQTILNQTTLFWIAGTAAIGLILALVSILYPAWYDTRHSTVVVTRNVMGTKPQPLWQKVYLDLFLLVLCAVVFWQTASTGYQIVLAPEGIPQASVSYETFIAPVFLWLGAGLLTMRLGEIGLKQGRPVLSRLLQPTLGSLAGVVSASLSRQWALVTRGIVLVALAFSFAVSSAVFNTTYNTQSKVDAELTNGADLRVTVMPGKGGIPTAVQTQLNALSGVSAMQPMQHRFAYVGQDLQDLYGIDAIHLSTVATLVDAYFQSGNAKATLNALAARPDGLLVAQETVTDFQLKPGDLINLRLKAANGQYRVIPFHFVDVVKEFPTAPQDSFLVANASYIAQQTDDAASEMILMRTNGNLDAITQKVIETVKSLASAKVTNIIQTQRTISSSLTAVDLRGLTRFESGFAILLLCGATGLVLALGMAQRQRTLAILSALGAKGYQLGGFLWSEGLLIFTCGSVIGIILGFAVAQMLVKVLTGVFDPPPEFLSIPWLYLTFLIAAASLSTMAAILIIQIIISRLGVETLREI